MNGPIHLTQQTHQNLIAHLVNFEEQLDEVINEYFPHLNQERLDFTQQTNEYKNIIEGLLKNVQISEEDAKDFPVVIIGSKVTIRDLESQEIFVYSISEPTQDNFALDDVSYISPVGRALLLKKAGEKVTVNTPAGQFKYEIISITYGNNNDKQEAI